MYGGRKVLHSRDFLKWPLYEVERISGAVELHLNTAPQDSKGQKPYRLGSERYETGFGIKRCLVILPSDILSTPPFGSQVMVRSRKNLMWMF